MHFLVYGFALIGLVSGIWLFLDAVPAASLESRSPALYEASRMTAVYILVSTVYGAVFLATFGRISHLLEKLVKAVKK